MVKKLKCWKKTGEDGWRHKNKDYLFVFKHSTGYVSTLLDYETVSTKQKTHKSKPQALKFAHSYMKKHDKC